MKRQRTIVAITAVVFLCIGAALAVLTMHLSAVGGPRHDPARKEDLAELRRLAYALSPAVDALRRRIESGAAQPDSLQGLPELPDRFVEAFPHLHYHKSPDGFTLYYKISWDSALLYEHTDRSWRYDPGDGRASTVIDL